MRGVVTGPEVRITSYWFRGVGATLADQRRAPWHERLPLGDWACKNRQSHAQGENLMPLRYSRSKVNSEKYVKLLHVRIMAHLMRVVQVPVTWDKTRESVEEMDIQKIRNEIAAN